MRKRPVASNGKHWKRLWLQLVGLLIWHCTIESLVAETAVLTPVDDASITEKSLDIPLGSAGRDSLTLDVGATGPNEGGKKSRALLKFDFAGVIPTNAQVEAANLMLTVASTPPTTNHLWFHLHKVLVPWSESAATWTNRLSPPAPWSEPGGGAGVDYAGAISQSVMVTGMAAFTFTSNPALVSDVQDWVRNPAANAGWIVICDQETLYRSMRKFASSEATNSLPSLAMQYSLDTGAFKLTPRPPANGLFQFSFLAEPNRAYVVERRGALDSGLWDTVTNYDMGTVSGEVVVSDAMSPNGIRFYRVRSF